jgi:hypothetical protein
MTVRANDTSAFHKTFDILMLMAMKEKLRFCSLDVTVEGSKPDVNVVVAVMDQSRRIMGYENVHSRKYVQRARNLSLLKQIVATGFIFPGTTETSKLESSKLMDAEVQILDCSRKRGAGIVIAFYGEDFSAMTLPCHFKNN